MLIVTGTVEINPEKTSSAQAAAIKMMEHTRKEDGCIIYEFSQLIEAPHTFRFYEEWESLAHLEAHFKTAHMAAFREALSDIGLVSNEAYVIKNGEKSAL